MFKRLTKTPSQTKKIGKILAEGLLKSPTERKKAIILGLVGDLGGGKTTFLQGFAKGLGIKEKITSPTFIIMKRFKIRANQRSNSRELVYFYHLDCYRVQRTEEILNLGFKEIASDSQNIVAIEWADKIRKILPRNMSWINFEFMGKSKRKIVLDVIK